MSTSAAAFSVRACALSLCAAMLPVATVAAADDPVTLGALEVTTSKVPVALSEVAANVAIVSGDE
ncbi:MAG: hypothetical protein ABI843_06155, partial [Dokdonella sp.]